MNLAAQHHLLAAAHVGAAEIDALRQAYLRAAAAQPEAGATRQTQQHGLAILCQVGDGLGMQMEADGKALAALALELVVAAQIAAIGRKKQAAMVDQEL